MVTETKFVIQQNETKMYKKSVMKNTRSVLNQQLGPMKASYYQLIFYIVQFPPNFNLFYSKSNK